MVGINKEQNLESCPAVSFHDYYRKNNFDRIIMSLETCIAIKIYELQI